MIPFIFTCKITYLAGNEHNCGLSFPARYYAEVTPVLSSLLFVIIALTRTVVAKNQQVQISISPPLPLLPFDRRPPPWYKFLSLLMALAFRCCKKHKMAALIFTKKIQSTCSPKLRLLCRLAKIILQLDIWYVNFRNRLWLFFSVSQGNSTTFQNHATLPQTVLILTVAIGITWILGLMVAFHPTPNLEYPYVIVKSCQGAYRLNGLFFIFLNNRTTKITGFCCHLIYNFLSLD